jgi:hypothetical protein
VVDAGLDARPSADAAADAGCDLTRWACRPFAADYPPGGASQLDMDSARAAAGSYCTHFTPFSNDWQTTRDCDYTETCDSDFQTYARCTSCGDVGRNAHMYTVDGTLKKDCRGCRCYGWSVYGCNASPLFMGERWADLVFQPDNSVYPPDLRFQVTESGRIYGQTTQAPGIAISSLAVSNVQLAFTSGAAVDLDITVDGTDTVTGTAHPFHIVSHVTRLCP